MALLRRPAKQVCDLIKYKTCAASLLQQQERGVCIFRRMYPPRLYKQKGLPRSLKRREYIYILEEDTLRTKAGDMEVILTSNVEGLGFAGDQLSVGKFLARDILFPADMAVYATPENIKRTESLRQLQAGKERQSVWAQKTSRALKNMNLPIPMNPKVSWMLNKTHVRVAFRNVGVILDDDCIVLPEEPITEPQDVEIKIIVNKTDVVMVNAFVHHHYSDIRDAPGGILPDLPPVWQEDSKLSLIDIAIEHARKIGPAPPPIQ